MTGASFHAPWLDVANAALREVGAEPLWQPGTHGPWIPGDGVTRDHYRSAVLAVIAVGERAVDVERRTRPGHVVCYRCWQADTPYACAEVTSEQALRFEECSR